MIELNDVSFAYQNAAKEGGLLGVSLRVRRGECVLMCGESGCGKTTLARVVNGLIPHFYDGDLRGEILVGGKSVSGLQLHDMAGLTGTVFQNPRSQFFNVDTTGEIAFGPENLGLPEKEILARIDIAAREMNVEHLLGRSIFKLSGGQKQKIACASVAALHPEIYVLDEPSSNLDMASVADLRRHIALWKSQGKTIVIAEHRLHYLRGLCDRAVYLRGGKIKGEYTWREFESIPAEERSAMGLRALSLDELRETRSPASNQGRGTLELSNFIYAYKRGHKTMDIPALTLPKGGVIAVIGLNGAGKSTFARCLCGLNKRFHGTLALNGRTLGNAARRKKCFMVMQDVNHQLFTESVLDEILLGMQRENDAAAENILDSLHLLDIKESHPMSLSGGEKQRVAIATAIASEREIIVFDEPTSGLDLTHMRLVAENIRRLGGMGKTVFVITHDPELILSCCTHAVTLKDGAASSALPLDENGRREMLSFFI
ncbi:MAG: energy-coupling factor ABC transporter ATP-binding protein [Clostridiales bacterium]|nr:energy-coupling factor ABC transporter ATP-binding protein [Clostridiales bacterium]